MIAHFAQIVHDETATVGCNATNFTFGPQSKLEKIFLMVCNYGSMNEIEKPVYFVGPAASQCEKISADHKNLCVTIKK